MRTPVSSGSWGVRLSFRSNGSSTWKACVRAFMNGPQAPSNSLWMAVFSGSNCCAGPV